MSPFARAESAAIHLNASITRKLVEKLANALIATKGIKHGRLMLTTSGRDLP